MPGTNQQSKSHDQKTKSVNVSASACVSRAQAFCFVCFTRKSSHVNLRIVLGKQPQNLQVPVSPSIIWKDGPEHVRGEVKPEECCPWQCAIAFLAPEAGDYFAFAFALGRVDDGVSGRG